MTCITIVCTIWYEHGAKATFYEIMHKMIMIRRIEICFLIFHKEQKKKESIYYNEKRKVEIEIIIEIVRNNVIISNLITYYFNELG